MTNVIVLNNSSLDIDTEKLSVLVYKADILYLLETILAVKFIAVMDLGVYTIYIVSRDNALLFLKDAYSIIVFFYKS